MVKVFVTGDNHIGKKYDRFPSVSDKLLQSRFDCLKDMVKQAELESCGLFVVTGDLFQSVNLVKVSDVKQVVNILASFSGTVLVLPGNHDYYSKDAKIWKDFEKAMSAVEHNITILKEDKEVTFEVGEETVVVYPACCRSKHSESNNLGWIKESDIQVEDVINLGIAHGTIQGIAPDEKEQYFMMTEAELYDIPVDAWLIGHTHVPYPRDLKEDADVAGYKIFNAGTHEQTDYNNNTEGCCFILTISKDKDKATVKARKYLSGKMHFRKLDVNVLPNSDTALEDALQEAMDGADQNTIVHVNVSGAVKPQEYSKKEDIIRAQMDKCLAYEVMDSELIEELTVDKIHEVFAETSFAAQFLEELTGDPMELQMAYQLLLDCNQK